MIKRIFIFLLFIFLLNSNLAYADFESNKWKFSKEIRFNEQSQEKLVAFNLDNEVFDHSKEGLSDLRILNQNGVETAYKLTVEVAKSTKEQFPAKITNLGSSVGEYTQFILDLGREGIIHNSVVLSTSSRDFRRQVEVEASADSQNWFVVKKANEGTYIYDYSLDFKAQNTTIRYPESTYRFLRLKIIDNGETPLRINGAYILNDVVTASRAVTYTPKVSETSVDSALRASVYKLDLGAKGIPSNYISFSTTDKNFNREVSIEGSNDENNWLTLGRDVIFNYDTPKFIGSKSSVNYTESNYRFLKISVFNRDNQPIHLSNFKVSGTLRKVLFLAAPNETYKLYYGNNNARFAEYDLGTFLSYFDTANTIDAVIGTEEVNKSFKGEAPKEKPYTEKFPYLLPGILAIAVLGLGSMVVKLAIQVKKSK